MNEDNIQKKSDNIRSTQNSDLSCNQERQSCSETNQTSLLTSLKANPKIGYCLSLTRDFFRPSEEIFRIGRDLFQQRNYRGAEIRLARAAKRYPNDFQVFYELGRSLVKQKKISKGLEVFRRAKELNPTSASVTHEIGRCYFARGKYDEAMKYFREALSYEARRPSTYFEIGRCYSRLKKSDKSHDAFKKCLELADEPDDRLSNYISGIADAAKKLSARGEDQAAAQLLETALEKLPGHSGLSVELGSVYSKLGENEKAVTMLEYAVKEDPNCAIAWIALARARNQLGDQDGELLAYSCALNVEPENYFLHYEYGTALLAMGRVEEAAEVYEKALPLSTETQRVWLMIGQSQRLFKIGDIENARQKLSEVLSLNPKQPNVWHELGHCYYRLGDYAQARKMFKESLNIDSSLVASWYELARLSRHIGAYSEALRCIERALEKAPDVIHYQEFHRIIHGHVRVYKENFVPRLGIGLTVPPQPIPKKILHVLETSLPHRPSGYGYRSHYLLKTQRALGLSPCASTRPGFPADYGIREFNDVDERDGVSYHRLKLHGDPSYNRWPLDQYLRIYAERLYGLAVKQQPQILHAASNFKNGFVAKSVSEALNIPWVYELRGLWEDTQVSKGIINTQTERYKFMRNVETFCLKSSHAIVTISETLRNEIVQRGVKAEKVFVVPNAVELDSFRPLERDQDLAQALKLGDGPVLGYVSSLVAYEGIEILVRGFAELLKSEPSARLLIVGDGEEYVRLQQLVTKLGIQNAAILTGRVPHSDVRKYYSLIDIFVVPRLPLRVCEIVTPLKPYEAMAMKKAVVVSDVAALKEMVQTDHTGLTFKAGDPSDLARVCLELCQQPDRRKDLGENAARWVKNYRTWESVVSNYFPAYAYALEKFGDPVSAQSYRVPFEQKVA